jgi:formamidopyrimidine-DNA glycosylase
MPELPDIENYLRALEPRTVGHRLTAVRLSNPFFLRTVSPAPSELPGRTVLALHRLGKRIAFEFEGEFFAIIHLMISGRLHWKPAPAKTGGKVAHGALDFDNGSLLITEASTRKRAGLYLAWGREEFEEFRPAGLEVMDCSAEAFRERLRRESHTIKRALTDPRLLSGIGNAYSDEILHRARMSPFVLTSRLSDAEADGLLDAIRDVLGEWTERLASETGDGFPENVTAFRDEMAVHGKFGQPCPVCGSPVQRIVYTDREMNYCVTCQTDGKVLADRGLSRLLKEDWPRTLEEMEEMRVPGAWK